MTTRMRQPRTASAGFTLIEVMISMFFLAFIVGEMAMVTTMARRSSAQARRVTDANMLAEAVLEKSRNTAWNNLNTSFSAADNPPDPIKFDLEGIPVAPLYEPLPPDGILEEFSETCTTAGGVTTCTCVMNAKPPRQTMAIYTVTRTVRPYRPPGATTLAASTAADISVAVSWTDARGQAQQIRLDTVRTKF
jgi:prepilin-type N-terminal cleavage/methylation domain-containing protein